MHDGFVLGVIVGAVAFMAGNIIGDVVRATLWRRYVEKIKTPTETVLSYDATILMDARGRLGWLENEKAVEKIKIPLK